MKRNIRLSLDEIETHQENALDLFYSGIKAKETKRTMEKNLKAFLVNACENLLKGDLNERAQEFVNLTKADQQKATNIVLVYVKRLRERTRLSKTDLDYLNPSTIPNKIKPIRKLLDMNNLGLPWKRIYSTYPELDNTNHGRGYTLEEIRKLLAYSDSLETDFIILASSSGGFRVGAWDNLTWGCVFPIYLVNKEYKIELNHGDKSEIICAAITVYKGTPEEYNTLISIETWRKLEEYKQFWAKKMQRLPKDSDPLLLERYSKPQSLTSIAVKRRIEHLLKKSGIRTPLTEERRRHNVPATHGFRRFWDKVMMTSQKKKGTLSALAIKERLMGHDGIVHTDKNYYWTDILDFVSDYLDAMPELMISEEHRLKKKLEQEKVKSDNLEMLNRDKDEALIKVKELEIQFKRMKKYRLKTA